MPQSRGELRYRHARGAFGSVLEAVEGKDLFALLRIESILEGEMGDVSRNISVFHSVHVSYDSGMDLEKTYGLPVISDCVWSIR